MGQIAVHQYTSRPRFATITEPVTADNWRDFLELEQVSGVAAPGMDVVIESLPAVLMAHSLHGPVGVQLGNSIVLTPEEAYPITADELDARYELVENLDGE